MKRDTEYDFVFHAQEHFRYLMDSMSKPGKINHLELDVSEVSEINNASIIIAFALLNQDVSFYIDIDKDNISKYIIYNTASYTETPAKADFLFLSGVNSSKEIIEQAKIGELEYPENSAFFIIDIETISKVKSDNGLVLNLSGPGINVNELVNLEGARKDILRTIQAKNEEYPLGIDTIFTDKSGNIMCLPRSTQFDFE